jgi:prepilin-type N-terminal cleavage/methylation domain-containing protein
MKFPLRRLHRSQPRGFTLVELLVVIAIIAILASVILFAGTAAIKAAKRTRASNMANQIQTATLGYYAEYSVYPVPSGVTTDYMISDADIGSAGGATWGPLIECLSGMIQPSTGANVSTTETTFANSRQVSFLTLKTTDVATSTSGHQDAPLNPLPPSSTSASQYFNIAIDADYDGVLGVSPSAVTTMPVFTPVNVTTAPASGGSTTAGVAVWANCVGSTTKYNSNQWVHTY